jgi:hypothetical protein
MARTLVGEPVAGAVKAGSAELTLVRPLVAVYVHVLAKVCLGMKTLRRNADFTL